MAPMEQAPQVGVKRMRQRPWLMLLVVVIGLAPVGSAQSIRDRGPIQITSEADFNPLNGVIGGTGTAEDPFIIADWVIHPGPPLPHPYPQYRSPVEIRGTTAFFVLRNVTISDWGPLWKGLLLEGVANGVLEGNHITGMARGADLENSKNIIVRGNFIQESTSPNGDLQKDTGLAMVVKDSQNVTISGNSFTRNKGGALSVEDSKDVKIEMNEVTLNSPAAFRAPISIKQGSNIEINENRVLDNGGTGGWGGIEVDSTTNLLVTGNTVVGNHAEERRAISIYGIGDAKVTGNTIGPNQLLNRHVELAVQGGGRLEIFGNIVQSQGAIGVVVTDMAAVQSEGNHVARAFGIGYQLHNVQNFTSLGDLIEDVRLGQAVEPSGMFMTKVSDSLLQDLKIVNIEGRGLTVSTGNHVVSGLRLFNATGSGLFATNGAKMHLQDCIIHGSGRYAVELGPGTSAEEISLNNCQLQGNELGDWSVKQSLSPSTPATAPSGSLLALLAIAYALARRRGT